MTCPTCKAVVANNAKACPQCGHRFTSTIAWMVLWLIVLGAGGVLLDSLWKSFWK